MYKAAYFDHSDQLVHIWGDGKHDDEGHCTIEYDPYAYIVDPNGQYRSIDGHKCSKVSGWTDEAVSMGTVYEHDVHPLMRTLIDLYGDSDEPAEGIVTLYIDIEVAKEGRYSTPEAAENTITSITYKLSDDENYVCLLLDKSKDPETYSTSVDVTMKDGSIKSLKTQLITFKSERELLRRFIMLYQTFGHSIITGWNVDFFDIPYLYNRYVNIMGYEFANMFSPIKQCKRKHTKRGQLIQIAGISILDYLMLYRKFTYNELSNYRLDTVCKYELGRGKIEYEGDLDHLYETDIVKFAEYNIVDVELVLALNDKLDFIATAVGMATIGHVPYEDVQFTSRYLDGASLTFCRRNNMIASSNRASSDEQAEGAFVKKPIPGKYDWVYDLDLTSLYPMNLITLNISPETKFGKVIGWDEEVYIRGTENTYDVILYKDQTPTGQFDSVFDKFDAPNRIKLKGSKELLQYMIDNNLSIASNGLMYDKTKQGVIPSILSMWFDDRANFKNLRKKYEKEGDHAKAAYYDKKQLITKIMLNSFYGVLLLPSFRFYDKDNGEAVTLTGQSVIHWATRMADYFYKNELNSQDNFCIYTDTDSIFMPLLPLLNHRVGDITNMDDADIIKVSKSIIDDVQSFVNTSYDKYALKFHNCENHRWDIKQELIAKRAFWVGKDNPKTKQFEGVKKRYAQWIVDKEGHAVREMDVKGLDVVRSNFPRSFRDFMSEVLVDILHDKTSDELNEKVRNFHASFKTGNMFDIMLPVGVKQLDKWATEEFGRHIKGTPVHVKSALNYNDLLKTMGVTDIPPIQDGDKILWCYLKHNKYNFQTIALKGFEDPEEIVDFVRDFIDMDKIFDSALKKKLTNFWKSLGWGEIVMNNLINKFFKF